MRTRSSLTHPLAFALWLGLAAIGCGTQILTHTEPTGEKIVISSPFDNTPDWCFLPVDIEAENPGRYPADWRISSSTLGYAGSGKIHSGLDFQARARDVARGSALMPMGFVSADHGGSYGRYITFGATLAGGGSGHGNLSTNTSSSRDLDRTTLVTQANMALIDKPAGCLFHHEQAPGDWRAYCGFHSLYLTATEWEAMSPAARTAIKHWVRLGGHLKLISTAPGKSPAALGFPKPDSGQETGAVSHGAIDEQKITDPHQQGVLKVASDAEKTDWAARAISGESVSEWEARDKSAFATPSAKLAAGFMLAVVVVFAVLVGPLNVFVFAAARRRHRLFFTTPLISLGAGGLLVISVILSDGIGGSGVRYVWLESAQGGENTNYLVQHQHSRCGAMFSPGFEIPEDAFFAPMALDNNELSGNLSIELEPGKVRAEGPWFSSRRSQNFYLAAARPGRGRIAQSGTADRPVLTSAFDFPIDRIFWLAPDGKTWWQAGTLAQGTATAMQPCTAAEVRKAVDEAASHAPPEYGRDLTTASHRPGYFLALASGITAIETHKSIRWQTLGFVTGPVVTP